jgi:hypothetical protein
MFPMAHLRSLTLSLIAAGAIAACGDEDGREALGIDVAEGAELLVDRVANDVERQRMSQYLDELHPEESVVHSFTATSGETIDCVDILAQPGLRRPGMEDHELQLAPTSLDDLEVAVVPPADRRAKQAYLVDGGFDSDGAEMVCPERTIPVLRRTIDTLARFETLEDFRRKTPQQLPEWEPPRRGATNLHQYAHAYRWVPNMGAQSSLNLWSPYVERASEFSLAQIWVTRGFGADLETVEAGWQVYPNLYGDWRARLFIYFTPDNYGNGGCYNLDCGAFVQTNNSVVIGGAYSSYSATNGPQWEVTLFWYKDGPNGHWWLQHQGVWVGYYPRQLFDGNGLRDQAALIDFGGEIIDTPGDGFHTATDMGGGAFAYLGWANAAYQRNLRYVDTSNFWREATGLTPSYTDYWCYDILLYNWGNWANHFYFGGSGYNVECE